MDLTNTNIVEENCQNLLNDIIESIKLDEPEKNNINITNNIINNEESHNNLEVDDEEKEVSYNKNVNLFSNDIDRKIGNYLFNEIEKKSLYIQELEDIIKFQEKEISELKSKLDSINKLELLGKLKSNITSKVESYINENNLEDVKPIKKVQVVQVKKIDNDQSNEYNTINQDLVFTSNTKPKPKFSDIDEPPRYTGISILEKPSQVERKIIIEKSDDAENSTEILKVRRRARKL